MPNEARQVAVTLKSLQKRITQCVPARDRDAAAIDHGGDIMWVRALHFERDHGALALSRTDDPQRIDLAQPLGGIGQKVVLGLAIRSLPIEFT